ncbi:uncharacterized protein MEPE_01298 [Melanopsichium pennsylvanicum]|uniref:Uncharacterized protein n=1 Tax=Melanopsichium pennsylvanicum TaxID=63383 RepID=A0AAJ5C3H2_9BASI|nr:uncharacterized protein MEPE_01298 [Melanopsichium pennsylvanicum]
MSDPDQVEAWTTLYVGGSSVGQSWLKGKIQGSKRGGGGEFREKFENRLSLYEAIWYQSQDELSTKPEATASTLPIKLVLASSLSPHFFVCRCILRCACTSSLAGVLESDALRGLKHNSHKPIGITTPSAKERRGSCVVVQITQRNGSTCSDLAYTHISKVLIQRARVII